MPTPGDHKPAAMQGTALRTLLATKLHTVLEVHPQVPSATGTALSTWLLVSHLHTLNIAALRAHIDEPAEAQGFQQALADVKHCIVAHAAQLQRDNVADILRRRGWNELLAFVAAVYSDTCGHFQLVVKGVSAQNRASVGSALDSDSSQHYASLSGCLYTKKHNDYSCWSETILTVLHVDCAPTE
jgi:hypothetical protein